MVRFCVLGIALALGGCGVLQGPCGPDSLQFQNARLLSAESSPVGSTQQQIVARLGRQPLSRRSVEMVDGRILSIWEFSGMNTACLPQEPPRVPVIFEEGKVIGAGNHFYHALIGPSVVGPYNPPKPPAPTTLQVMPQPVPPKPMPVPLQPVLVPYYK